MAGELTGADVAQLRDLARQLELGSRRVVALGEGVRAALAAAPWVGQRADDYRRQFTGTDLAALRSAAALLDQAASTLRRNADEQERASSAAGTGAGGGTGAGAGFGGGGGGSWGSAAGVGGGAPALRWLARGPGPVAEGVELVSEVYEDGQKIDWLHRLASGDEAVLRRMAKAGEAGEWGVRDIKVLGHGLGRGLGWVGTAVSGWEVVGDVARGDYQEAAWDVGGAVLPVAAGAGAAAAVGAATWGGGIPAAPVVSLAASTTTSLLYERAHEHFHPEEDR